MKTIQNICFAFATLFLITSCSPSLTPFTQDMYDRSSWSEEDLKRIQFYVSSDIVLNREFTSGESAISNGKIKIKNGKKIEEVIIRSGTPGALLFIPKENRFAISFEQGNESPFLMFGPNPKINDRYALLAKEWKKYGGKVHYAGNVYNVSSSAAFASLLVDMDRIGEVELKRKVAQGRTVN